MPRHFEIRRSFLLFLFIIATTSLCAQAPKWQKKAHKAMLSLITYGVDGQMLHTTNGFFIHPDGTALSDYHSFQGAVRAVAFDGSGNEVGEWIIGVPQGKGDISDAYLSEIQSRLDLLNGK